MGDGLAELLSLPAPIYPEGSGSCPPRSILLDPKAYLSPLTNGTTARGSMPDGRSILVTFWPADPPRVSCFTIHCPGLDPSAFAALPTIVATHDDLVLLRVPLGPRTSSDAAKYNHLFVYQAARNNQPPSLTPIPPLLGANLGFVASDSKHALLRCRGGVSFLVAVLLVPFYCKQARADGRYHLHVYSSETGRWSAERHMYVVNKPLGNFRHCITDKAITIGGDRGTVGWVDLWGGIIICHLHLVENDENTSTLTYVPVPDQVPLMERKTVGRAARDIIVDAAQGCIKFFEMRSYATLCSDATEWWRWEWKGVAKKMNFSSIGSASNNWEWEEDGDVRNWEVTVPTTLDEHAQILPPSFLMQRQGEEGTTEPPTLKAATISEGFPALSLHDDGVVYLLIKVGHEITSDKGLVIAVDMRNKTLKSVAEFGGHGRPVELSLKCLQSDISKHVPRGCSFIRKRSGEDMLEEGIAATSAIEEVEKGIAATSAIEEVEKGIAAICH